MKIYLPHFLLALITGFYAFAETPSRAVPAEMTCQQEAALVASALENRDNCNVRENEKFVRP